MSNLTRSITVFLSLFGLIFSNLNPAASETTVSCPRITWGGPMDSAAPNIFGIYYPAVDQYLQRVNPETLLPVEKEASIIGCYAAYDYQRFPDGIKSWQVGIIDRDASGYFWKNAQGKTWRLTPDFKNSKFNLEADYPYIQLGETLEFDIPFTTVNSASCKIKSFSQRFSPGFSRTASPYYGRSQLKFKVIIPEFSQDPKINPVETLNNLELSKVTEFFKVNSFSKQIINFEYVALSKSIEGSYNDYYDKSNEIMKKAFELFTIVNPSRDYDGLIFALPKEYKNKDAGYATSLNSVTSKYPIDARVRISWIGSAPHNWGDPNAPAWKVTAHELGHNLGLSDLYAVGDGSNYDGNTIGPFDIMGSLSAKANELTFWNRWLLGWLQDEQVFCAAPDFDLKEIQLQPVNSTAPGYKGIVVPLTRYSALLIESRRATGYDSTLSEDEQGIVVYKIDTTIPSGRGPIKVIPKLTPYTTRPYVSNFLDMYRFLKAPLQYSDSVISEGISIANISSTAIDTVLIANKTKSNEFQIRIDAIKQEIKAKADAIAKAEADAKAKAEAEAKVKATIKNMKTIVCIKGKTSKKVLGVNPKCPAGYRKK